MPRDRSPLPLRHAIALGLAQGPTELLPVSSSGHTTLIPWLLGWSYQELDAESRKAFEVALHAGAGLALAIDMRGEMIEAARGLDRRRIAVILLSIAPPAISGYALRGPIERRLGGPRSIAAGLLTGALAMALADRRPRLGTRPLRDARPADGLALGAAQAIALIPGISRNGATLTAARARGFGRGEAQTLSWQAALPVIIGAGGFEVLRLSRRGGAVEVRRALAAGGGAAFLSTLASSRLLRRSGQRERALLPWALYRCMLARVVLRRLRSAHNRHG
jgi:undecaprenyl-diphosphatase